jgi:hypothetical protein
MLKSFWFWFAVTLVAMQFIRMDVPLNIKDSPKDEIEAPKEVMSILKRSCYDCHSNHVQLPWYDTVAPARWFVKNHIKKGRKVVNFSIWNSYTPEKQYRTMKKLPKSIVIRMPMPSYLWLHSEAKLSKKEKNLLKEWAINLKENIK